MLCENVFATQNFGSRFHYTTMYLFFQNIDQEPVLRVLPSTPYANLIYLTSIKLTIVLGPSRQINCPIYFCNIIQNIIVERLLNHVLKILTPSEGL